MKKELQDAREDYRLASLEESLVKDDPIDQFKAWFRQYQEVQPRDFNAMTLGTIGVDGFPANRVVLLKGIDQGGFEFYTNYQSDKAREIAANNRVSLTFFWPELERQVRVSGLAEKLPTEESDQYWQSRPYGSRIGAWVSPQSQVIPGREILEQRQAELENKYSGEVPRPPHWGGYRVLPARVEFWQGRSSRLHDRINYRLVEERWVKERLAP